MSEEPSRRAEIVGQCYTATSLSRTFGGQRTRSPRLRSSFTYSSSKPATASSSTPRFSYATVTSSTGSPRFLPSGPAPSAS